jgi:hypothetical protein
MSNIQHFLPKYIDADLTHLLPKLPQLLADTARTCDVALLVGS